MSDFETYARIVWDVFVERRGSDFPLISPAEYGLLEKWFKLGVQPRWVATALRLSRGKSPKLWYYEPEVLEEARRASRALNL